MRIERSAPGGVYKRIPLNHNGLVSTTQYVTSGICPTGGNAVAMYHLWDVIQPTRVFGLEIYWRSLVHPSAASPIRVVAGFVEVNADLTATGTLVHPDLIGMWTVAPTGAGTNTTIACALFGPGASPAVTRMYFNSPATINGPKYVRLCVIWEPTFLRYTTDTTNPGSGFYDIIGWRNQILPPQQVNTGLTFSSFTGPNLPSGTVLNVTYPLLNGDPTASNPIGPHLASWTVVTDR